MKIFVGMIPSPSLLLATPTRNYDGAMTCFSQGWILAAWVTAFYDL